MTCSDCGNPLAIGDWPFCPHGKPSFTVDAHAPVFDFGLGRSYTSNHERRKIASSMNLLEKADPAYTPAKQRDLLDKRMANKEQREGR